MPYKIRGVNPWALKIRAIFRRYLAQDPMPVLIMDIQGIDIVRGLPQKGGIRVRNGGQKGYELALSVAEGLTLLNGPFKGQNRLKRILSEIGGEKGARPGFEPGQNPCRLIHNIFLKVVCQRGHVDLSWRMAILEYACDLII